MAGLMGVLKRVEDVEGQWSKLEDGLMVVMVRFE
jgi:hypothetical protein